MDHGINESLESLSWDSDKNIGGFKIRRNNDFIVFKPSIKYKSETITRIKIQESTFKHFGPYTLEILFMKLVPGLNGRDHGETLHSQYNEKLPSAVFLSTLAGDAFPNYNTKTEKEYNTEAQFRGHNVRVGYDDDGPYLDWFHISPIREKQYKKSKQSEDTSG